MPSRSARALSSIRAAMTNPPSVSRGLCGGVFLRSRASCLSLSVFIGLTGLISAGCLCGLFRRRKFEPVLVIRLTKAGAIAGHKALIVHFDAVVERFVVSDYLPRVGRRTQVLPNKFVLPDLIRSGHFNHRIFGLAEGYLCHRGSVVIC